MRSGAAVLLLVVQVRDGTATLAVPTFAQDLAVKIASAQTTQ